MKKLIERILAIVLCFLMSFNTLAATSENLNSDSDETLCELKQTMLEINQFIQNNSKPLDLKNQEICYVIPLSNNTNAKYTLKITKNPISPFTVFDAKVGEWFFDSTLDLPNHGSIKVRTTVNITKVPDTVGLMPEFTAYDGKVTAIPSQYVSVDATLAETKRILPNIEYQTTGYVGFNIGGIPANYYFTQIIAVVDNQENYNKIQCVLTGEY